MKPQVLRDELTRLAPAPEETLKEKDIKVSVKQGECSHGFITGWCDACESAPEWRELGPDEVIQEGDECLSSILECPNWGNCIESVGDKPANWEGIRFRTRRPLTKQEEMPLEDELKDIDQCADKQPLKASKTELPHPDSMSTNADNLKMTTSNDNEVVEVSTPSYKSMLTAQSDSVELYHALCDRSADFSKALDACRDYRRELDEKNNEVARLRELLNESLDIAQEMATCSYEREEVLMQQIKAIRSEARLAPAPQEPVTGLCLICHEKQTTCSSGLCEECQKPEEPVIQDFRITEPEWRIKEKGEIIEAEDQYNSPMAGWVSAPWVGEKIETAGRIRTRRPFPKQEEMPLVMVNPENFWKWMELQEEINRDIAGELQSLRDEIQNLKDQPHFHHESYCRKCHEVVTNNV